MTRPHDCIEYIDLRYAGADDHEGHLECCVCRATYSAEEAAQMHADIQRDDERGVVAVGAAA